MYKDLLDLKLPDPFVQQFLDLWINPEVKRRHESGGLSDDFVLYAAQVVMNFDAPAEVRLNEEVKAIVKGSLPKRAKKGEHVSLDELDTITEIELTPRDPNAGHLTIIAHKKSWLVRFDFRYNAARCIKHIDAARQFIDSSRLALERNLLRVVVDNLFSACELMAKASLLMHDKTLLTSKKHRVVHARYNKWGSLGNTDARYTKLLNRLSSLRNAARYLEKDLQLSAAGAREMLDIAENMLEDVSGHVSKRDK